MRRACAREICRRPGAAHACKQCLVQQLLFLLQALVPQGVPLQERKIHVGRQLTLFLAARDCVAAYFGTRASINSARSEAPHDFSNAVESTRSTSNLTLCDLLWPSGL